MHWLKKLYTLIFGAARNINDPHIFHKLSLIAFFAWVGLGADGLTSSCYGPEEAFLTLGSHKHLALFVGLATVFTIFIIAKSYNQIIELFPSGGGGYLVASKLLSPTAGMVSGCALLIDYVLTITLSIASGADAIFSFLPERFLPLKLSFAIAGVVLLTIMNMRGIKEAVLPLVPIFLAFIATHVIAIGYTLVTHFLSLPQVVQSTMADVRASNAELGLLGTGLLILRAYSMGAGTFTGIEAVSNGMPILRDPKIETAKHTMRYMAWSLSIAVMGLMVAYVLYGVQAVPGKTLNAVLFDNIIKGWPADLGYWFVLITLLSEAVLLFVAAQTGFLDGPRVLSNMAVDRWFPTRFAMLSDRLVTQNGILIMGALSLAMMTISGGSVRFLVVLYSINVFITFTLSQLSMVRHWWQARQTEAKWRHGILVNGIGLLLTSFILVSVIILKFDEGGWITIAVTGALVAVAIAVRKHYANTAQLLRRLDSLVMPVVEPEFDRKTAKSREPAPVCNPNAMTAVIFVSGFNGLGLHTLFGILRLFGDIYKNFVFVQVGVIDAGNFKGVEEIHRVEESTQADLNKYVTYMKRNGFYAEGFYATGIDITDEILKISPAITKKYPQCVFFGGQVVFPEDSMLTPLLHNYIVFSLQRKFYHQGIPFVILPIRV